MGLIVKPGLEIPDADLTAWVTIGDLVGCAERLVGERA